MGGFASHCPFLPPWLRWEEAAEPPARVSSGGSWGEPGGLGRSCQSGQQRLLPTLTWHPKGLTQPWTGPAPHGPGSVVRGASPGGCTHSSVPSPRPQRTPGTPGWGPHQRPTDPWHRLSSHHCSVFPCQENDDVATSMGENGKELPRATGFESVEVLRVSLSPPCTPWFSSLGYGCEMQ